MSALPADQIESTTAFSKDGPDLQRRALGLYLQTIHRPTVSSPNTTIAMIPTFFGESPDEIDSNKND